MKRPWRGRMIGQMIGRTAALSLLAAAVVASGAGAALAQEAAGIVAPSLTAADYPTVAGVNSRVAVWLIAQLHLWFAAFVLAEPIFVLII